MALLIFLIFAVFLSNYVNGSSVYELTIREPSRVTVKRGSTKHFCITSNRSMFESLYLDTNIYVVIGNQRDEFPWHSVRGASSDDLSVVLTSQNVNEALMPDIDLDESFFNDIWYTCPSPLFPHHDKSVCKLSFPVNGRSCVSTTAQTSDISLAVVAQQEMNLYHIVFILLGFIFIAKASGIASYGLFQYVLGSLFFIATATVLITLFILNRTGSKLQDSILFVSALTTIYFVSVYFFLTIIIKEFVLEYWELGVFYAAVMFLLSLPVIDQMRTQDRLKPKFLNLVTWMVRICGIIALSFSSSSQLLSLVITFISVIIISFVTTIKPTGKKRKTK